MSTASTPTAAPATLSPGGPLAAAASVDRRRARDRRRRAARWFKRGLIAAIALALVVSVVAALRPAPVPVDIGTVRRGALVATVDETGRTRVDPRRVVTAPVTGTLPRLTLEPGDPVTAGAVLSAITPATSPLLDERSRAEAEARLRAAQSSVGRARTEVAQSEAAAEQAQRDLARQRRLFDAGAIAQADLEKVELEARAAREALAAARFGASVAAQEVARARAVLAPAGSRPPARQVPVLSPISGEVLRVLHTSEGLVQAGTPLLEVGDLSELEIVADVLSTDAVRISPGAPVQIVGWGGERPLAGRVKRIEPSGTTRVSALGVEEQRVDVVIGISEPRERWRQLGDGYRVQVRIQTWRADDLLAVPASAVFRSDQGGTGWATYRIVEGRARRQPVGVGRSGGDEVQITSGLEEGDRVVLYPSDRVEDDARVEPRRR